MPELKYHHISGFAHPLWPVVTDLPELQTMNWGLIPHWTAPEETADMAAKTLNARSETLEERPAYRHLIHSHRCIIPANGFFEYQAQGRDKMPYFIYPQNDTLFAMAGLYDVFEDPSSGTEKRTFTIVTCEANALMKEIHNTRERMPVFLQAKDYDEWLNAPQMPQNLLQPLAENFMAAHQVNPKILTGDLHNTPESQKPWLDPRSAQQSLF